MEIVHRDRILHDAVAEFVGGAIGNPPLDTAAGQPDRKGLHVVVAAIPLRHRRAAKFGAKHNERFVEHAAPGQILHQRCGAAIDFRRGALHMLLDRPVMVPIAVVELDEPHAPFGQPAGQQAVGGKGAIAPLRAIEIKCALRLIGKVDQLRHARLHLEGQLILREPGGDFRIVGPLSPQVVEPGHRIDHIALPGRRHAGWRLHVKNRIALRAE